MWTCRWWARRWGPEQLWRRLLVLLRRQCADPGIAEILTAPGQRDRLDTFDLDELFAEVDDRGLHVVFLLAGLHPYFLQAACCVLYDSHQQGLGEAHRIAFLAEKFRVEAVPHIVDYWDNSADYEKIVLTAAALLERTARPVRGFSLKELQGVFSRGEPWVEHLAKRGLVMSWESGYRLFSSVLGPWVLDQIVAELSEEKTYHDWLADNHGSVQQIAGLLKTVLGVAS